MTLFMQTNLIGWGRGGGGCEKVALLRWSAIHDWASRVSWRTSVDEADWIDLFQGVAVVDACLDFDLLLSNICLCVHDSARHPNF